MGNGYKKKSRLSDVEPAGGFRIKIDIEQLLEVLEETQKTHRMGLLGRLR